MGNKLLKNRFPVEEKYTRPQGLHGNMDVNRKKLRKLILDSKLAPCYPGDEESIDLEECPICYLYYPSLNRSKCCVKGICTECFLQMNSPNSTCPTSCPFCKTPDYGVEYRGRKTKEERRVDEMEERKTLEAKMRIQEREQQEEEERLRKKKSRVRVLGEVKSCKSRSGSISEPSFSHSIRQGDEIISCEIPRSSPEISVKRGYEDYPLDLVSLNSHALWHNTQVPSSAPMIPYFFHPRPSGPALPPHNLYWGTTWAAVRPPDTWMFTDTSCYSASMLAAYRIPYTIHDQTMLGMGEPRACAAGAAWM